MSKAKTTDNDSNELEQTDVFQRFSNEYYTREIEESDGIGWRAGNAVIALLENDATEFGYIDCTKFQNAEYVETDTVNETRCYRFNAGDYTTVVACEYVRELANDVFHVSYDQMKEHAKTIPNAEIGNVPKGLSPVMFDLPGNPFVCIVAPVQESEE